MRAKRPSRNVPGWPSTSASDRAPHEQPDDEVGGFPSSYELTGSPGLVEGCAAGDLLEIDADGLFQVVRRGPNLCIQAFGRPSFDAESLESLNSGFVPLGGLVGAPADRRFIVVTVPAAAGFPAVEAVMERWAASVSVLVEWGFSNVFGPDAEPLNWWLESGV
ncbi:DUF4265 domain-containing protein [Streptomyces cyaneofuscatus]|uniref:DUF4265 domain-containing protein n=1 Tax=Streptomyces cyaneofuscatus TaxID=66883 RepID=UPI0034148AF6